MDPDREVLVVIGEIGRVVTESFLAPTSAAKIYAYALSAAEEARDEGGSPSVAAYEVMLGAVPDEVLERGPLRGLADRERVRDRSRALISDTVAASWRSLASADGLESQLVSAGVEGIASGGRNAVDVAALRSRLGISEQGISYSQRSILDQPGSGLREELLADEELFRWEPMRTFYAAEAPEWGGLVPIVINMDSLLECRSEAPDVSLILDEALVLLENHSSTAEHSDEVSMWLGGPGTVTPTGMWVEMASGAARGEGADPLAVAAAVARAAHNSMIVGWFDKYGHNLVRPETLWSRLFDATVVLTRDTPSHPAYPSGHSLVGAAAKTVVDGMLGEGVELVLSVPGAFGIEPRRVEFADSEEALQSISRSRITAGFHYPADIRAGEELGACVARVMQATS